MSGIISTIFIAVLSSFITFQFSAFRFRSEKWWELKVQAYQGIIDALHEYKRFSSVHLSAYHDSAEVSDKYKDELTKVSMDSHAKIVKTIDIGAFLFSDAAMVRLKQYLNDTCEAENTTDWHYHLEMDNRAAKGCLVDLIAIAKDDLDETNTMFSLKITIEKVSAYFVTMFKKLALVIKSRKASDE